MQAYKWQMYTVHTNIKMVYTVYGLYNMNNGYNRERTFKYCSFVGKQCPCEVTIARVSRAMKHRTMQMVAMISILGKQAGTDRVDVS